MKAHNDTSEAALSLTSLAETWKDCFFPLLFLLNKVFEKLELCLPVVQRGVSGGGGGGGVVGGGGEVVT